jgi:hypothetical protein
MRAGGIMSTQRLRLGIQAAFALLCLWIGVEQ